MNDDYATLQWMCQSCLKNFQECEIHDWCVVIDTRKKIQENVDVDDDVCIYGSILEGELNEE